MCGWGPRATTVYESQVILSIKDTPLGLKFCRDPDGGNGGPKNHRVLHGPTIVPRPPSHLLEPERLVEPLGNAVRFAHLEVCAPDAPALERAEHLLYERAPNAPAPVCGRHGQIKDLAFVSGVVCNRVSCNVIAVRRHQKRHADTDAVGKVPRRPGVGEGVVLDRGDVRDVSRPGGPDPEGVGRGGPPILPALPQDVRRQVRQ
jgi:hypothetical protein